MTLEEQPTTNGGSAAAAGPTPGGPAAPAAASAGLSRQRSQVYGSSKMLRKLGLSHNPYVDRTAEKSILQSGAFYLLSDLQGFQPSEMTYIFFGKRGSGKTTIRLMMLERYEEHNARAAAAGVAPIFVANLCRPGHMNDCLKQFMRAIGADKDNWDANFAEEWSSNDLADCVVSFTINDMMRGIVAGSRDGKMILRELARSPRSATQFLLLAHLYTREDSATLQAVSSKLLPIVFSSGAARKAALAVAGVVAAGAAGVLAARALDGGSGSGSGSDAASGSAAPASSGPAGSGSAGEGALGALVALLPSVSRQQAAGAAAVGAATAGALWAQRRAGASGMARARELCAPVRVGNARPDLVRPLLNRLFSPDDSAERIRALHIGHSAQQKLELLQALCKACGYEALAVFGDCFDEVGLLDPLLYPTALKVFAREVCKNEVLNQGSMHFFFPDARASLDLSTDRIVREARFDRHFVRDLTWSRFQLWDLAERRFLAAQDGDGGPPFQALFKHVSKEDFSGAISKLATPRELMVFMTELLARVEAHSEDGAMVASQDMEIAVNKAQEQAV